MDLLVSVVAIVAYWVLEHGWELFKGIVIGVFILWVIAIIWKAAGERETQQAKLREEVDALRDEVNSLRDRIQELEDEKEVKKEALDDA